MEEVFARFSWLLVATIMVAYASFLFLGSMMTSGDEARNKKVIAMDRIGYGVHYLSGSVPVPSPCHGLAVRAEERSYAYVHLAFQTWQEPSRDCKKEIAYVQFHTVTFGPSIGTRFSASLDGAPVDLQVVEVYSGKK